MRSISYVVGGTPKNRSDCLDYCEKGHALFHIILIPHYEQQITEEFDICKIFATWVWIFSNTAISYEESYGGVFSHENYCQQKKSIDNANRRLMQRLAAIEKRLRASHELLPSQNLVIFDKFLHRLDLGELFINQYFC